jgi:hypothetical protein
VHRNQIVALIECGIFHKPSLGHGRSLDNTRDPDLYRPKPGFGAYQSLMHWALYVKDDHCGEDLPSTDALDSGSSDDDEFGENSFVISCPEIKQELI